MYKGWPIFDDYVEECRKNIGDENYPNSEDDKG